MKKMFVLLLLFFVCRVSAGYCFWSSDPGSLKELAKVLSVELKEKNSGIKRLYLDKVNVKDAVSGETSNLSAFLANELDSALSSVGFEFSDFIEQAELGVGVSYQKDGDKLRVFVKYCSAKDATSCKSLAAAMSYSKLPKDSFSENLDSKLKRLVKKASGSKTGLRVFISPVVEKKHRYSSEFSEYVTTKARSYLVNSQQFEVLEEQPVTSALSNTRSLAVRAKEVKNLETSAAQLSGADAVLDGYYLEGAGNVTLAMTLKNLKGGVLGSSDETIEKSQIPFSMVNQAADALAEVADVAGELKQQVVKLHTTKGDNYQIYRAGEKVQFLIQVMRPLYIYLYAINTKNEVNLLYPGKDQRQAPLQAGKLHTVPGDKDSWEIVVEPPFGTDVVKLFASERPLPLPGISNSVAARSFADGNRSLERRDKIQGELAGQREINAFDLVDYFKGTAAKLGTALYEDSLFVQTRPH